MARGTLLYEDGARRIYYSDDYLEFVYEFRGGAAEYDGETIPPLLTKPPLNMRISAALFRLLESNNIATHFIRPSGEGEMAAHITKTIPVAVVCRNVAAGSFAKRTGMPEGEILPTPVIEFNVQSDALRRRRAGSGTEIFTEITDGHVKIMFMRAIAANRVLESFFHGRGLALADWRTEFGVDQAGLIRICGALCPDTCRLWGRDFVEKLDKDRFRRTLRGGEADYEKALAIIAEKN